MNSPNLKIWGNAHWPQCPSICSVKRRGHEEFDAGAAAHKLIHVDLSEWRQHICSTLLLTFTLILDMYEVLLQFF